MPGQLLTHMVASTAPCSIDVRALYSLLGIELQAPMPEIRATFRHAACKAHPSRGGSTEQFDQVVSAFHQICCVKSGVCLQQEEATLTAKYVKTKQVPKDSFNEKLHSILRRLPPAARREVIACRLSQQQRKQLEIWMLERLAAQGQGQQQPSTETSLKLRMESISKKRQLGHAPLSMRSLRFGSGGYRPGAHIAGGIYAQAPFSCNLETAVDCLAGLLIARVLCQKKCFEASAVKCTSFSDKICAAVQAAFGHETAEPHQKLYFRTRLAIGRGQELATPSRTNLAAALKDWHQMHHGVTHADVELAVKDSGTVLSTRDQATTPLIATATIVASPSHKPGLQYGTKKAIRKHSLMSIFKLRLSSPASKPLLLLRSKLH